MKKKKIYIAGFDVFLRNAVTDLESKRNLCMEYGYEGLIPFDANIDFSKEDEIIRKEIYTANIQMIKDTDIIIANMNNFRHNEPDSGTVFELGFGVALGKEVYIYSSDDRTVVDKTKECDLGVTYEDGLYYDQNNMLIEGFDAKFNIMINESTRFIHGDFESVLKQL